MRIAAVMEAGKAIKQACTTWEDTKHDGDDDGDDTDGDDDVDDTYGDNGAKTCVYPQKIRFIPMIHKSSKKDKVDIKSSNYGGNDEMELNWSNPTTYNSRASISIYEAPRLMALT